jgi:hypothetical protein
MPLWKIVNAPCETAESPSFFEPVESLSHRFAGPEVEKITRNIHRTTPTASYV